MWYFLQLRILLLVAPFFGAVLWMGAGDDGVRYEETPAEVKAAIADAVLPIHVLGGTVRTSKVWQQDERTVITALLDGDGTELMRFVTSVEPDGRGAFVRTDIEGPQGQHAERAAKAMQSQPLAVNLLQKLADEHVDAAIEGRSFDMMFAAPPQAKTMLANMPGLSGHVANANAAAADLSERASEADAELAKQLRRAELEARRREVDNAWRSY